MHHTVVLPCQFDHPCHLVVIKQGTMLDPQVAASMAERAQKVPDQHNPHKRYRYRQHAQL